MSASLGDWLLGGAIVAQAFVLIGALVAHSEWMIVGASLATAGLVVAGLRLLPSAGETDGAEVSA